MTRPSTPLVSRPVTVARLMHGALLGGPLLLLGVLWLVVGRGPPFPALQGTAGYVVYAACGAGFAVSVWVRGRIPRRGNGESETDYWAAALPRAILLWGLLEAMVTIGGAVGILAGHRPALLAAVLIYLVLIASSSPRRLAGE